MDRTSLLVIGAGPYGLAVAARAKERGVDATVVGRPLGFWTEHMPRGMFLRSGPDWHLDASGVHTFEAFLEERGITAADIDPLPIGVFLDYATWFAASKGVVARDLRVERLERQHAGFVAHLEDGSAIGCDAVVASTGPYSFHQVPEWATELPREVASHTSDLVEFEQLRGARVLIVGGRQSAYEWAALLGDHGAAQVDIVHRHDIPAFARVSWKFVDPYIDATIRIRGWWRSLPAAEQEAIARQFWEVGRLTLEWWLTPRLAGDRLRRRANTYVVEVDASSNSGAVVQLSDGERLSVDHIIFATGYKADLRRIDYLSDLVGDIAVADGAPGLDEGFQSSISGLYFTGFASMRDFGPFFGFTKGCPAAATILVDHLLNAA